MNGFDDDPELDGLLADAETGDSEAMVKLGDICVAENLRPEAQSWYRQAAEAGNAAAYRGLGMVALSFGQTEDAIRFWREGIAGGDAECFFLAGSRMIADRPTYDREGFDILERGFAAGSIACGTELGSAYLLDGDPVEARQWFEKAAAQREPNAARTLAAMMEAAERIDEAEQMYRYAADLGVVEALAKAEDMAGFRNPEEISQLADEGDADAMVAVGRSWLEAGDLPTAVEWLSNAVETGGGSGRALVALGDAFADHSDFDEADHWYRQAHEAGSRLGTFQLCQLMVNEGRFEEAADILRSAATPESRLLMSEMAEMDGDDAAADRHLEELAEMVAGTPLPDYLRNLDPGT